MTVRGIKGLAEYLGLSRNTVSKMFHDGLFDSALILSYGRCYIFDADKIGGCKCKKQY